MSSMNETKNFVAPVPALLGAPSDTVQLHAAQERLRLAQTVIASISEGVVITDPQGRIVDVNGAFESIMGYTREQVLGRTPAVLSSGRHSRAFYQALWAGLLETGQWRGEICNRRATGELVLEELRITAVHSSAGALTHYVGTFSDVTREKRQAERLQRLAHYDALTGLPNRALALDRLGVLLASAGRHGRQVAVCCLDLDGFVQVNERLGHVRGDALLVAVGDRLRHAVRGSDTVARTAGDEFVILLGDVADAASVHATLERVLAMLARPFALGEAVPGMGASVGAALYPDHGATPEQLLRAADQSLYRAKRLGRGRVCMSDDDGERSPEQRALLDELRVALPANQLCLHYQPKVCARTRQVLGAEALVRWQHPTHGLLAPGVFLPAVVGTSLEVELDLWVVRAAVAQLARWRSAGRELGLSINVSPGTLVQPDLAGTVAGIVSDAAAGAELRGIELEVLETAALDDLGAASRAIEACARQGIAFALDDFGTGYSSLSYLRRLPVNTLKIDRSFVSNMLADHNDLHIVRAVIGLAEAFGVNTVAEGVETEDHARALAELGCKLLQGYGIARPMPAQALEAWLDEQAQACNGPSCPASQQCVGGAFHCPPQAPVNQP
jgi:diguanylate cyclase (GGDEF)-like protein/PAS domain S-box-containing protein